jgi:hypothetical protein
MKKLVLMLVVGLMALASTAVAMPVDQTAQPPPMQIIEEAVLPLVQDASEFDTISIQIVGDMPTTLESAVDQIAARSEAPSAMPSTNNLMEVTAGIFNSE